MSRNNVTITTDSFVVEPVGWSRVWSFARSLQIPLDHVRGATVDPGVKDEPKGRRGPGLRLPRRVAGTFHADGRKQFWNVFGYDRAIVVTLDGEKFDRLVITVDDPDQVVDAINRALGVG